MKIDWTQQPTPEHCWLEDKRNSDFSGWYVLGGSYWLHESRVPWHATQEDEEFTIHRNPEEYVPKAGDVCEVAIDFDAAKNDGNWAIIEIMYIDKSVAVGRIIETEVFTREFSNGFELDIYSFRPIKTDRELLIDIILGVGNMSEGVLADAILEAGFKAPD